jgi:hypothetical protein
MKRRIAVSAKCAEELRALEGVAGFVDAICNRQRVWTIRRRPTSGNCSCDRKTPGFVQVVTDFTGHLCHFSDAGWYAAPIAAGDSW